MDVHRRHSAWAYGIAILLAIGFTLAPNTISDPDLWWHLRTGEWILQNASLPSADPFSTYGADRPWVAYTWAFDVLLCAVFSVVGPIGICYLVAGLCAGVAIWIVHATRRSGHSNLYSLALVAVAMLAINGYGTPRPWWASIAGIAGTLEILRRYELGQRAKTLLALPLLYAVWANMHIQFCYGLVLLVAWIAVRILRRELVLVPVIATCAAGLATLMTPYGIGVHRLVLEYARHASLSQYIEELRPPDFASAYMIFIAALGVWAASRIRRTHNRQWHMALLIFGALLFARSRRDGWVLIATSAWTVAESALYGSAHLFREGATRLARTAIAVVALVLTAQAVVRTSPAAVATTLASEYPVAAVRHLPQTPEPIYTPFNWGGYVLLYHRASRVTFDGRTNVHGVERTAEKFAIWNAERPWQSDPELAASSAVLAPVRSSLYRQLSAAASYRVAYEDEVAAVIVPVR